jgi:hypothetical protein
LLSVIAAIALAMPVDAAEPLADAPFSVAAESLFGEARNDGRQGEQGAWELLEGRLANDALHLTFRIEPPRHTLPVEPGPAVLFGGLNLFGDAGGDMGAGMQVDSLAIETLPPCSDRACQYDVEIALPVDDLRPAIERLEIGARLMWVSADLTLVRTFGGGSWLQVLPFAYEGDGVLGAAAGSLGAIKRTSGRMFPYGLFPSELATPIGADPHLFPGGLDYGAEVERRRRDAGDSSQPLQSATGRLQVTLDPACQGSPALTLHDEGGDRIYDSLLHDVKEIDEQVAVPVGVPWWLTLHDGGGIDFDQGRLGWGVRIGPIGTTEAHIAIEADFDCSIPRGVVRVNGEVVGATDHVATPEASVAGAAIASPHVTPPIAASPVEVSDTEPTQAHVALFLVATLAGLVVLAGLRRMRQGRR